jgi:transposase
MGIRDDQWDRIKDILPGRAGHVGVTARNNRLFIDAVLYRYRTGIPWRELPEKYGDFRNVHRRFSRWAEKGIWARLLSVLAQEADTEYVMIDSTVVRAHQHSAGAVGRDPNQQAIGRSRGGLSIHALTDALGNPTRVLLTPGQAHDLVGSDVLLTDLSAGAVIADKPESKPSFRPRASAEQSEITIGSFTRPATSSKISSASSNISAPSRHATISWHGTSRRLFSSPPP